MSLAHDRKSSFEPGREMHTQNSTQIRVCTHTYTRAHIYLQAYANIHAQARTQTQTILREHTITNAKAHTHQNERMHKTICARTHIQIILRMARAHTLANVKAKTHRHEIMRKTHERAQTCSFCVRTHLGRMLNCIVTDHCDSCALCWTSIGTHE